MIIVKKAHNHVKTTDKILRGIQRVCLDLQLACARSQIVV